MEKTSGKVLSKGGVPLTGNHDELALEASLVAVGEAHLVAAAIAFPPPVAISVFSALLKHLQFPPDQPSVRPPVANTPGKHCLQVHNTR